MTKEEAWRRTKGYLYDTLDGDEACEIIEILEQELYEDAISRADVKKYLAAPDANGDRVIYESDLDLLPSVQPGLKTGHWIDTESGQMCSRCGKMQYGYDNFRRYCSSCGCKND